MQILCVDDDPIFLEILVLTLGNLGLDQVTTASSADEAFVLLRDEKKSFDCFLLDIQMPGTNGIELCRNIRCFAKYSSTPVLMITALSDQGHVDDAFKVGATDYVSKPIDEMELKARLKTAHTLVENTRQLCDLSSRVEKRSASSLDTLDFRDSVVFEDVTRMTSLLALENYLYRLGTVRALSYTLVGCHISNARTLYSELSNQDFIDIMGFSTEKIFQCIPGVKMFSYCGEGEFIAIIDRISGFQRSEVEDEIRMSLDASRPIWDAYECSNPSVFVGKPVNHFLINRTDTTTVLQKAIEAARAQAVKAHFSHNNSGLRRIFKRVS
ncbi:response regulator [Aliiroseovarius subalbicans]|uniref:response regulator n=1 Tax=Aliiroseovarius subalbicans TaxID=2925840 RepID=UPI001F569149|nr:response regulator [Aliiroseovarius subalbicans]MCI2399290.1 response regulator [Aliiroseovarius subalbicans]